MISLFRHKRRSFEDDVDELFRSSYPLLYRHAYSLLKDEEECRDVVSEVFVKVLEKRMKIPVTTSYLMAMVHNKALDKLKRQQVEDEARRQMLLDYKLLMDADEDRDERLRKILTFIEEELTPQTQRILRMCYDEKKSYKEVAAELDISIQAVNKHISQALRKLRERFNPNQH